MAIDAYLAQSPTYAEQAATIQRLEATLSTIKDARDHVEELRDAWQRGALESRDGHEKDAERSNRNADIEVALRSVIAAFEITTPHEARP